MTEDDLLIVAEVMRSATISPMVLVPVLVVAVIVALAAAYISIAVGVTVALAAAITVSIALHLAVVASGDKQRSQVNPDKRVAFDGSMARLDPDLMKNSERAIRMAKVMGDPQLEIHVMKRTIREEVSAFPTNERSSSPIQRETLQSTCLPGSVTTSLPRLQTPKGSQTCLHRAPAGVNHIRSRTSPRTP